MLYRVIKKTTDKHQQWVKYVNIRKYVNTKFSEWGIQKSYEHFSGVSTLRYNGLPGHAIHDRCTNNIGEGRSYTQPKCDT